MIEKMCLENVRNRLLPIFFLDIEFKLLYSEI